MTAKTVEFYFDYGSPAAYLAQVEAAVCANLAQGFLLPPEAERIRSEARKVPFQA